MDNPEFIAHLQNFGLSEDDARIYTELLRRGPCRVSEICKITETERVKGYRILDNLKNFGFVTSTMSNPTTFSANDLKNSLQKVVELKQFEVKKLEKLVPHLVDNYESLRTKNKESNLSTPQFNIISGRQNIYAHIEKMVRNSETYLYIVTTSSDLAMMYYTSIPESIKEAQKKGLVIYLITEISKSEDLELIRRLNIKNLRLGKLPSRGRIVCNTVETLVSGYTEEETSLNSTSDSAFITNSNEFINNMKCLCNQLCKKTKTFDDVIKQKEVLLN